MVTKRERATSPDLEKDLPFSTTVLPALSALAGQVHHEQIKTVRDYLRLWIHAFQLRDTAPAHQSPIQLLRPPGLCSAVWLIFTKLTPSLARPSYIDAAIDIGPGTSSVRCGTSNSGLVAIVGVDTAEPGLRNALLLLSGEGDSGESASRHTGDDTDELGTGRNASAYHSYHTLRVSVSRHSETVSSQSAGT